MSGFDRGCPHDLDAGKADRGFRVVSDSEHATHVGSCVICQGPVYMELVTPKLEQSAPLAEK